MLRQVEHVPSPLISDLFHPDVPVEYISRVFEVISETPQHTYQVLTKPSKRLQELSSELRWPSNLWMGVSVETSRYLFRLSHLRTVPAAVRFLSAEPLLGPLTDLDLSGVQWVITGGESGPRARPTNVQWVRYIRDACRAGGVAFFHKHWGGRTPNAGGRGLDGRVWDELPQRQGAGVTK